MEMAAAATSYFCGAIVDAIVFYSFLSWLRHMATEPPYHVKVQESRRFVFYLKSQYKS